MPPPGYEPFLRAICAAPEDDTVRLVYADWLDENGAPARAEFIRLQIALASRRDGTAHLIDKVEQLRQANEQAWAAELTPLTEKMWNPWYSRGFIFGLHVRAAQVGEFMKHIAAIFSATPVTQLSLDGVTPAHLATMLKSPEMQSVRRLNLSIRQMVRADWRIITQCPHLTNVQYLSIRAVYGTCRLPVLTEDEARPFVESPTFARLSQLSLTKPVRNSVAALLRTRLTLLIS